MQTFQELLRKYLGTLVGVHAGDSIGAPYETMRPREIARDIEARDGLVFFDYKNPWPNDGNGVDLPAGRPTDDSEQTAVLAFSLLRNNGLCIEDLHTLLRHNVIDRKSLLWEGLSTGSGQTTRDALSDNPKLVAKALSNSMGTNGSLMRCSPMALWFGPPQLGWTDETSMRSMVFRMSKVTHAHPHALQACWMYTAVLLKLLAGYSPAEAIFNSILVYSDPRYELFYRRVTASVSDDYLIPYDPGAFPGRGLAEFSLFVALYALKHATSFRDGIEIAVRVGGDTDTYAAIAGGLLGAHFGYGGIPEEWRRTILGHNKMCIYAEQILKKRMGK